MRGATLTAPSLSQTVAVSIHAPHAGRDRGTTVSAVLAFLFQSTRPMRGATAYVFLLSVRQKSFNPRAPCGARPYLMMLPRRNPMFQSTRPMRGATFEFPLEGFCPCVSIHAPHAGRDQRGRGRGAGRAGFNPRAPCGARPPEQMQDTAYTPVSIHAPHAGRDPCPLF